MSYACHILNQTFNSSIKNTPLNVATSSTCDASPLLYFHFWQPVYFNIFESSFSSKTAESRDRFLGTSKNAGHDMTCKILSMSTNKIIYRSEVRPSDEEGSANLRANPLRTDDVAKSR